MLERLVAREIDYLWSRLARATRKLEALAPLWSRGSDPRVVRVVESAAYAFARVKEKLEDDIPEISHALVASALPEVLRPMPSATIVQLADPTQARRSVTEHGRLQVESRPIGDTPCVFETCWPVVAAPVAIERTVLRTPEPGLQTLTLRVGTYGDASISKGLPDPLRVFVQTKDPFHALDVVHALRTSRAPVHVRALSGRGELLALLELPASSIRWSAVDGPLRLFPGPADRFASGTALRAFYAFPEVFAFFDIQGLGAAVASAGLRAHAIEVTIRLGEMVSETAPVECLLDCTPAVNVFDAVAIPLEVHGLGSLGPLRVAGHSGAEIFDITRLRLHSARDRASEIDVRLWERDSARELSDDALYLRLERRASIDRGPTEFLATLGRPKSAEAAPVGELHAELLASDGLRTESLLRGDITRRSEVAQITNITRVTPPSAPVLDARLPWRVNAYARMPVMQFASAASLAAYVELHNPRRGHVAERGADPASAGFVSAVRRSVHRVERDEVAHGDEIDLVLDEAAFGGRGATWLVGELVARAIAERADLLRFSRTRWVQPDGRVIADYERRNGERIPPPFG
jgi:type VI secretion system protein ImpG